MSSRGGSVFWLGQPAVVSCDPVTPFAILKTFRPENQPESSGFHSGSGKQYRQRTSLKWGGVTSERATQRSGFPGGSDGKETARNAGDPDLIPGLGRFPGEENSNPLQYPWPGESHWQRSLVGYSPWGGKELDTTEMSAPTQDRVGPEWWPLLCPQVASTLDPATLSLCSWPHLWKRGEWGPPHPHPLLGNNEVIAGESDPGAPELWKPVFPSHGFIQIKTWHKHLLCFSKW